MIDDLIAKIWWCQCIVLEKLPKLKKKMEHK